MNQKSITLQCNIAGYYDESSFIENDIVWSFMDQPLSSNEKYMIFNGKIDCPTYGRCGLSRLEINDLNSSDLGEYVCSFESFSQTISLTCK